MSIQFHLSRNGYTLPSGKIVDSSNINDIETDDILELANIPVSVYDHLKLRSSVHELANAIGTSITNTDSKFEEIKEMLEVDLSNGKQKKLPIGVAFKEMYERERGHRHRLLLLEAIKDNKIMLIILSSVTFISLTYYFNQNWFLTGLIPVLVSILKDILKK